MGLGTFDNTAPVYFKVHSVTINFNFYTVLVRCEKQLTKLTFYHFSRLKSRAIQTRAKATPRQRWIGARGDSGDGRLAVKDDEELLPAVPHLWTRAAVCTTRFDIA